MPASFNQITVTGHLGKDPDMRYTPQGTGICSFTMAVSERRKNTVSGEWEDNALWFKVKVWGKPSESASQYLSKGSKVLVTGRLSVEQWTGKDGNAMTTMVIDGAQVTFLDGRSGGNENRQNAAPQGDRPKASTPPPETPAPELSDDDIPF